MKTLLIIIGALLISVSANGNIPLGTDVWNIHHRIIVSQPDQLLTAEDIMETIDADAELADQIESEQD
jgi:hypothetical protein